MWIPTIFLNLWQAVQQMGEIFSGELPAGGLFRFPKDLLDAAADAEEPLQTDIARLIVRNELLSSSQILAEAEELLDETQQ